MLLLSVTTPPMASRSVGAAAPRTSCRRLVPAEDTTGGMLLFVSDNVGCGGHTRTATPGLPSSDTLAQT